MNFVPVDPALPRHPKTLMVACEIGESVNYVWPRVVSLWMWAFEFQPDGDLTAVRGRVPLLSIVLDIADVDRCRAFFNALVTAGFIDENDDGTVAIHDWNENGGGRLHQKRQANAERMSRARAAHVQRTCSAQTGTCANVRVNRTEQNRTEQEELPNGNSTSATADKTKRPRKKREHPTIDWSRVWAIHAEECPALPQVDPIDGRTKKRTDKFLAAWKTWTGDAEDRMESWRRLCERAAESKALAGKPWADFSFILSHRAEIKEGKYLQEFDFNKPKANPTGTQQIRLKVLE